VIVRRTSGLFAAALVAISACGGSSDEGASATSLSDADAASATAAEPSTAPTPTPTTVTSTPPPTTNAPGLVLDPACVATVEAGDSLSAIATRSDVEFAAMLEENWLVAEDVIHPGDRLDVCIDNDIDDVTGSSKLAPPEADVRRQQEHLNGLFAQYHIAELLVDGDSGPLTRQMLCAARLGLGLSVSAAHLAPGSEDETTILASAELSTPEGAPTWARKWILIDNTCQVLFTGEGDDIVDVFPTSTGSAGFETRRTQAVEAFRFDPALDNGGWHDSAQFPTAADAPQNGNMYKPIYFLNGQAIHGANYVPPEPRSKGCARTFPWHQDVLISWIGIDNITEATWRRDVIGVTVAVQGRYRQIR
jgi:LysM repeat protein